MPIITTTKYYMSKSEIQKVHVTYTKASNDKNKYD